jgi:division protein CdvB (Snf7/Vps24/ESCRT-III family)
MTAVDSTSASNTKIEVTSRSLFDIASNTETTLDHLDRLVKMASEKLENLSPYADVRAILAETEAIQTLLDAVALYLGKMGDSVNAMYLQSRAMPETKAELDAIYEEDAPKSCC